MDITATQTLILSAISQYGQSVLAIISAIIVIALAYLVFTFGVDRLLHDKSLMIGGYYVRSKPYKSYNRFRSQKWNMEHTM